MYSSLYKKGNLATYSLKMVKEIVLSARIKVFFIIWRWYNTDLSIFIKQIYIIIIIIIFFNRMVKMHIQY